MFLRLFENFVKFPSIRPFLTSRLPLAFPFGKPLSNCRFKAISASKVARSADRGLFKILPYVKPSPCFFLLSQKSAKIVSLFHRLPLGGRLRREAVVRGATCFLSELFQSSGTTCSPSPCFPLREPLSNCRFKAISASRVASDSEPREVSPFLKQSPL